VSWAAVFLAAAIVAGGMPAAARLRPAPTPRTDDVPSAAADDPLAAAAALDVLAACLRSGMAVPTAAAAVAASAPTPLARALRRAADLLALGAGPERAWADTGPDADRSVSAFLRMARRSAASGAALAQGVDDLATQVRAEADDAAAARSERAAVVIAGPLGLCYLPAFLCLGIVPVVAGLAGDVLQSGLL
jgi:pilus assembly protein TadC